MAHRFTQRTMLEPRIRMHETAIKANMCRCARIEDPVFVGPGAVGGGDGSFFGRENQALVGWGSGGGGGLKMAVGDGCGFGGACDAEAWVGCDGADEDGHAGEGCDASDGRGGGARHDED